MSSSQREARRQVGKGGGGGAGWGRGWGSCAMLQLAAAGYGVWGVGRLRTVFTLNNLKHSSQRSCRGRANSEHDADREEDAAAHPLAAAARAAAAKMQREEDVKKPKKPMDL